MKTVRIVPVVGENGDIFLDVYGDNTVDRVGPLRADEEMLAVLEAEKAKGATPPTKAMKRLSQKQELRNANLLGGRTQPGSGSMARAKGDVRKFGEWRGESKFTFAASYSLTREVLEKINGECKHGEKPLLFLDYKNRQTGKTHGSYVVMHESDFEELVKKNGPSDNR
jgi:hypothetical protein